MGSVVSEIGSAVGNLVGGVVGGVGGGIMEGAGITPIAPPQLQMQDFAQAIQNAQDIYNNNVIGQRALANTLAMQAQGQGPNLAAMQLKDATNRNIANAQGMVASQKGINPALAARLSANNAAMANQQAAGQAAQLRAQQQLAAQEQLGKQLGTIGSQSNQNQDIFQRGIAEQNRTSSAGQLGAATANMDTRRSMISGLLSGLTSAGAAAASGGASGGAASGGLVNEKDQDGLIPGDHPQNDIVDAKLSPGEIVIPRSVAMSKDAPDRAKEFVEMIKKEKKMNKGGEVDFKDVIAAQKKLAERMAALEKRLGSK